MKKATWKKTSFAEKIVEIIRTSPSINEMREQLQDYHDNDIAQSLQFLNRAERNLLYSALDAEWLAEIISYLDDPNTLMKSALTSWPKFWTKWMRTTRSICGRTSTRA